MSNHKSTESAIKNLEIQVGQLAKQIAEKSSSNFGANTEQNPKEECKAVMTRGRMETMGENEGRVVDDHELVVVEEEEDGKETNGNQLREDKIKENEKKEINEENNKEKEKPKQKEKEKKWKNEKKEEEKKSKSECAC